jgi:cephalosporin hydroxylase
MKDFAMLRLATLAALATLTAGPAFAQACAQNFRVEGFPGQTAVNYRTQQAFPNVAQDRAIRNMQQALAAEGFSGVKTNKSLGSLTAVQETSGSGRPQTLRLTARKMGASTLVDAVFMVQPGQAAPEGIVRDTLCRVVLSAGY